MSTNIIEKEILRLDARREREEACIKKRIEFNNRWFLGKVWTDDASYRLDEFIKTNAVWASLPLNENAYTFFCKNPLLDKSFALFLDSFDAIPYHPDFAFDIIWRVFEISLYGYGNSHWSPCPEGTHVLINKACTDIISPSANKDEKLLALIEEYLANVPLSLLRYMFSRMYFKRELGISQQLVYIQDRCKIVIGDIYELIAKKYNVFGSNEVSAQDQRNASLLLSKILRGEDITLGEPQRICKALSLEKRIELFINGILFTSRCERFHGDVPSPFKNSLNVSLKRYQSYYFMAAATALLYYCVLSKEAAISGTTLFTYDDLAKTFGKIRLNISNMYSD